MEDSLFTKIIKGDIPCHKIYEDDKTFAFLTINPVLPGHVLVIPKKQVDHLEDLSAEDYHAVFSTVQKVSHRVKEVFKTDRVILSVMGFEVPHAHVHVVPSSSGNDYIVNSYNHAKLALEGNAPQADDKELAEIAQKLAF
ncbi:MAG: putative Histidine triad protein [Candidatus Saccharibacteria bacterium]|nr:putative Histidine triad protein [Candidatus Saccharibacteria bacterium]